MTDCRSCLTCLNFENGECIITGDFVRGLDYCSYWDNEEEKLPMKVRKAKKNAKKKKESSWDD